MKQPSNLYCSLPNYKDRIVITRWRLSCYKLYIEIGRYKRPNVIREVRKCKICNGLEDEEHALYACNAHQYIRSRHKELLQEYNSVNDILNPKTPESIKSIARYIKDIEDNMNILDMLH